MKQWIKRLAYNGVWEVISESGEVVAASLSSVDVVNEAYLEAAKRGVAITITTEEANGSKTLPYLCEKCGKPAVCDCEPIPGTTELGWENEPTARCEEHAKGLLILRSFRDVSKD